MELNLSVLLTLCVCSWLGDDGVSGAQFASSTSSSSTTRRSTTAPRRTSTRSAWTPPERWRKQEIPDPRTDVDRCGREGKRSWVCDPDMVISVEGANELDEQIDALRRNTGSCHCEKPKKCPRYLDEYGGWQAGVAIVRKLQMENNPSSDEKYRVAESVADYLRDESWEFGVCNDDLLILVSKEDRIVYTRTGDAMSGILTDACVTAIYEEQKIHFTRGDFARGLKAMIYDYQLALLHEHQCNKPMSLVLGIVVAVVVTFLIGGVIFCVYLRNRFCPECGSSGRGGGARYDKPSAIYQGDRRRSKDSQESGGGGGGF